MLGCKVVCSGAGTIYILKYLKQHVCYKTKIGCTDGNLLRPQVVVASIYI